MDNTANTADNTSNAASETVNEIKRSAEKEIAALRAKVAKLMDERVKPEVEGMVAQAETVARDTAAAVRHQTDRVAEQVQERPLVALGVAVAIGYVLAVMLRR